MAKGFGSAFRGLKFGFTPPSLMTLASLLPGLMTLEKSFELLILNFFLLKIGDIFITDPITVIVSYIL